MPTTETITIDQINALPKRESGVRTELRERREAYQNIVKGLSAGGDGAKVFPDSTVLTAGPRAGKPKETVRGVVNALYNAAEREGIKNFVAIPQDGFAVAYVSATDVPGRAKRAPRAKKESEADASIPQTTERRAGKVLANAQAAAAQ